MCYAGNTFINVSKYYQGKLKENTMVGAELIGDSSIDADFEIISMVIDCMKNAGLTEFQVEIGNVSYFKGLLDEAGISGDDEENLVSLIQEKNFLGVEELLESLNIDKHIADVLLALHSYLVLLKSLEKAKASLIIKSVSQQLTDCMHYIIFAVLQVRINMFRLILVNLVIMHIIYRNCIPCIYIWDRRACNRRRSL